MASKWDEIKSRKIRDALRKALKDDKFMSHGDVVEIVRATLDDSYLTFEEMADLNAVARASETMPARSKLMLGYLIPQAIALADRGPFSFSTARQKYAADMILDFMKRSGSSHFPNLDRDIVGVDLLLRVANPNLINQRNAGLCGPVSFLYLLAFDSPAVYARFAIDLFEKGKARIGRTDVEPGSDCRNYSPRPPMSHGEWLTAGSLRDSENFFLDFDEVEKKFAAGSSNGELARWFERAGYTDVHHDDNAFASRSSGDINLLNKFYNGGYRVVLRINSKMLKADKQSDTSGFGNHFVVLRSPITVAGQTVSLVVYTWGKGQYRIPQGSSSLSQSEFAGNLYGYVAAKPF